MADVIFTKGSFIKSNSYQAIINLFKAAGWTDVSSNPTTDFVVLNSKGEAGNKSLFIQLRPFISANTTSIETTDNNVIAYRLIGKYTPGASGVAGTFERPSETWSTIYTVPTTTAINKDITLDYHVNVNKNRMIIAIESPPSISQGAILHYIGLSDATYGEDSDSRGLLVANSAYPRANQQLHITNAAETLPSDSASSTRLIYCTLAPKNPNSAGLFTFAEMLYGNPTEGIRGKLNGIFALPAGGLNNGDIINVGLKKFRIIITQIISNSNSFPTTVFALQIS